MAIPKINLGLIFHPNKENFSKENNPVWQTALGYFVFSVIFVILFIIFTGFGKAWFIFNPDYLIRSGIFYGILITIGAAIFWFIFSQSTARDKKGLGFDRALWIGLNLFIPTIGITLLTTILWNLTTFGWVVVLLWQGYNFYLHTIVGTRIGNCSMIRSFFVSVIALMVAAAILFFLFNTFKFNVFSGLGSMAGSVAANPFR